MGLQIVDLCKTFGQTVALDGVSFDVAQSEIVAVLGPSGCGKSTLLSVVAGLETPDRGQVLWDGVSLAGVPPHRRGFGLMFQDYALFPHMNVLENVAFGLRMAGLPAAAVSDRVGRALEQVGLPGFGRRDVTTLSGGEQQRVALARSLAPEPRLLMLDEPLGALDRTLRERLLTELPGLLRGLDQTVLFVTHDQEEAFAVADRVVVMNAGRVAQVGTPEAIYRRPASVFVARFLGLSNLLEGIASSVDGRPAVQTAAGLLPARATAGARVTVLLRPDAFHLGGPGTFQLHGHLVERTFRGSASQAVILVGEARLTFEFPSGVPLPAVGEAVQLAYDPDEALQVLG